MEQTVVPLRVPYGGLNLAAELTEPMMAVLPQKRTDSLLESHNS